MRSARHAAAPRPRDAAADAGVYGGQFGQLLSGLHQWLDAAAPPGRETREPQQRPPDGSGDGSDRIAALHASLDSVEDSIALHGTSEAGPVLPRAAAVALRILHAQPHDFDAAEALLRLLVRQWRHGTPRIALARRCCGRYCCALSACDASVVGLGRVSRQTVGVRHSPKVLDVLCGNAPGCTALVAVVRACISSKWLPEEEQPRAIAARACYTVSGAVSRSALAAW
jgi:hypothetical protein